MINYPDLNKDNIRYQSAFGKKISNKLLCILV